MLDKGILYESNRSSLVLFKLIFSVVKIEFNNLLSVKRDTLDLLKFLEENNKIDSTILNEFKLSGFYISETKLKPMKAPVRGIVTRGLELKGDPPHNGVDIAAQLNSSVKAVQTGLVIFSGILEDLGKKRVSVNTPSLQPSES